MDGRKIEKSAGNAIDPFAPAEELDVCAGEVLHADASRRLASPSTSVRTGSRQSIPSHSIDNCVLRGSSHAYEEFGADALLSYLPRHFPSTGDADFSRERFPQAYESELACAPRKTFSFTFAE